MDTCINLRYLIRSILPERDATEFIALADKDICAGEHDKLAATAMTFVFKGLEYDTLGAQFLLAKLYDNTPRTFSENVQRMIAPDSKGRRTLDMSDRFIEMSIMYKDELNDMVSDQFEKDKNLSHAAVSSLLKIYLAKRVFNGVAVYFERPQYLWLRTAITVSGDNIDDIRRTYEDISGGYYTHATPTLIRSGFRRQQLSSCFLMSTADSLDSMIHTQSQMAVISAQGGGLGVSVTSVRAAGSEIYTTNGASNGVVPYLKVIEALCKHVDQGGKRPGACAIYIEPWHADILSVLEMKNPAAADGIRAPDLFVGLWMNDLFMERLAVDGMWSLFCPSVCPDLAETYGDEFERLYLGYEADKKYTKQVKASQIWKIILARLIDSGSPYILMKDHVNKMSNQKNVGIIRSSNLCAEVVQTVSGDSPSGPDSSFREADAAACNLASVCVSKLARPDGTFDFEGLEAVVTRVVRNLNNVIDVTLNVTPGCKRNNDGNRPMGMGMQGLADALMIMNMEFESKAAIDMCAAISEHMYYAAVKASCQLAKEKATDTEKGWYPNFVGSPLSQGIFHFDMYDSVVNKKTKLTIPAAKWEELRQDVITHGVTNSLFIALMPTASSAMIMGNSESFEPYMSNLFSRKTQSGEHQIVSRHLYAKLVGLGLWSENMWRYLVDQKGSVQDNPLVPAHLKPLFKTVWEIKQKSYIDMAIARAPFVDQSQSMSLYFVTDDNSAPLVSRLSSAIKYAAKNGLKTGIYYMRSRGIASVNFVSKPEQEQKGTKRKSTDEETSAPAPKRQNAVCTDEICVSCSS